MDFSTLNCRDFRKTVYKASIKWLSIRRLKLRIFVSVIICTNLLSATEVKAQMVLNKDSLETSGHLLNRQWKFKQGDSVHWSMPEYNDQGWSFIDPVSDVYLQKILNPGEPYWFRLRIKKPDTDLMELAMIMQQSGAATFYLDGKQIHQFGNSGENGGLIHAWDPVYEPVSLTLPGDRSEHTLAVRYVLQPGILYTTIFEARNAIFHIKLFTLKRGTEHFSFYQSLIVGFLLFISGVCLLQSILHFAFYVFYPAQKANLSIALYSLGFLIFSLIQYQIFLQNHDVAEKFWLANLALSLRSFFNFFLLSALYNLLGQPKDRFYWLFVALLFASFFLNLWPYDVGWKMGGALMEVLIGARISAIAIKAVRRKVPGAWIILTGSIVYFIAFGIFFTYIFRPEYSFLQNLSPTRITFYIISFMAIPVSTSIYLGLDFALVNRRLQQKLEEIKSLSEKNLRSEIEKQEILENQNVKLEEQVRQRTNELSESLRVLKDAQYQLIQSEKMASLGELTAGIAHEIQNPLNFVNNFSDVNRELIDDLNEELDRGNTREVKIIAENLRDNESKINHHGKRADAIVKSMLQHSRASTGQKELTDINALAEEYIRLSYHGLRAKDKSFNTSMQVELDPTIGKINIISQDMGRVFLNLFNNSFYAVSVRQKKNPGADYSPAVSLYSKRSDNHIIISIKDNGGGIPEGIRDKIFQPFFTTKPTGEGTGLGLSLAYDIIKAHGGQLQVNTEQDGIAEFIIQLPYV